MSSSGSALLVQEGRRSLDSYAEAFLAKGMTPLRVRSAEGAVQYLREARPADLIVWGAAIEVGSAEDADASSRVHCEEMRLLRPQSPIVVLSDWLADYQRIWPESEPHRPLWCSLERPPSNLTGFVLAWRSVWSRSESMRPLLEVVRRELEQRDSPLHDVTIGLQVAIENGEVEDIERIRRLVRMRTDLDPQMIDMAREAIRWIQERAHLVEDIRREEDTLLRGSAPSPRDLASRWVAVRRGKVVMEAPDQAGVDAALARKRRTRPHYQAIILSVDELRAIEFEGLLATDDAELWGFVQDQTLPPSARLRALDELIERSDTGVPAFAVVELEREGLLAEWRDGLLVVTERMVVLDPELRIRLTRILLTHAKALRGGGATPALWAALRRYATLVPANEAESFLEFLDDAAPGLTHQVVFQCIANVFSVEPPADGTPLDALRARVVALAGMYLSVRPLETGEQMSLATNVFAAAAALGSEDLERLEGLIRAQRERWLVAAAIERLRGLAEAWKEPVGGDGTQAFHVVAASLGRLSVTSHGST